MLKVISYNTLNVVVAACSGVIYNRRVLGKFVFKSVNKASRSAFKVLEFKDAARIFKANK